MPISKPHSSLGSDNTNSCTALAFYLIKENDEIDKLINKGVETKNGINLHQRKNAFFSHSSNNISIFEVIDTIDNNKRKLGKNDAKFFAPTISFSNNELLHLVALATEGKKRNVNSVWELTDAEYKKYCELIRQLTREIMTNYAKNFNRSDKGLIDGNQLVYFAKIEHFRKFKGNDPQVLNGDFSSGEMKPGLQSHVHCIASRKDRSQKLKLSPLSNEKSKKRTIGNNSYHVGFDRKKWTTMNESTFDQLTQFKRPDLEKFENQYILKNGAPEEKNVLLKRIESSHISNELILEFPNDTLQQLIGDDSNFDEYDNPQKKKKKNQINIR